MSQEFGGHWTLAKLAALRKYLVAYRQIMSRNERARYFTTVYVDAFAGSGNIHIQGGEPWRMLKDDETGEMFWPIDGSAKVALDLESPFDRYVLVEKKRSNVAKLHELISNYPELAGKTEIVQADSNSFLKDWVARQNWKSTRAIVFLDPFAMQVDFETIACLGDTKGVDLWLLFPIHAVNRVLVRRGKPFEKWKRRLDRFFGTDEWEEEFYKPDLQPDLFTGLAPDVKAVTPIGVTRYFCKRMEGHYEKVIEEPLILKNSNGTPIFALIFASANPKGASTAIRIARDIIKSERDQKHDFGI